MKRYLLTTFSLRSQAYLLLGGVDIFPFINSAGYFSEENKWSSSLTIFRDAFFSTRLVPSQVS